MNAKKSMLLVLVSLFLSAPCVPAQWRLTTNGRRLSVQSPASLALYYTIRNKMYLGRDIDVVTETPAGGWLMVNEYNWQRSYGVPFPAGLSSEISTTQNMGLRIDDIAFDSGGDWILVAGTRVRTGGGIDSYCVNFVRGVTRSGQRVRSIAFDPDGTGWVVATDTQVYGSQIPWSLNLAMIDCATGKRPVRQVRFGGSTGGGWIITTDRWSVSSEGYGGDNAPDRLSDEVASFKRLGFRADKVAAFGNGWVVVSNGALPTPTTQADQFLTSVGGTDIVTRMQQLNIPGVSIALVKDKRVEWVRGYGIRENGKDAVVTPRTRFPAASLSKAVAAMTALSVMKDGLFDLDQGLMDIVNDHTNSVDFQDLFGEWVWSNYANEVNNQNGFPIWVPDDVRIASVTPRMLLSHTSGLNMHGIGLRPLGSNEDLRDQLLHWWTPHYLLNANERTFLIHTPATEFDYSGGGFCAAEALIEAATQQSFQSVARDRVLVPLGMYSSTFAKNVNQTELARGHDVNGNPLPVRYCPGKAAGGLTTTAADYARFISCVALDGRRHVDAPWNDRILDFYTTRYIMMRGVYNSGGQLITNGGVGANYPGLGVFSSATLENGRPKFLYHGGTQQGFRTYFRLYPSRGEGLVVMINGHTDAGGNQLRLELRDAFISAYL